MTPDDELLERARRAREASRTARQRANAALARIENADIYHLRTSPVIEITLGLGNDCSVRHIGTTRSIARRRP
jgi:hypothetical protein